MRHRRILVVAALALAAIGYAAFRRPAVRLDPERLARAETEMWKAYYGNNPRRLGHLLVTTLHAGFGLSWWNAARAAVDLRNAATAFRATTSRYDELVLPSLERAYERIRRGTGRSFDPHEAARAELDWWVARRSGDRNTDAVGAAIARLYGVSGSANAAELEQSARFRAEAADLRDRTHPRPDWDGIELLLRQSYEHFCRGMASEI